MSAQVHRSMPLGPSRLRFPDSPNSYTVNYASFNGY